jgi:ferrochelatase
MNKVGVLLVNLGTPNSPSNSDVYKYLIEFLLDKRVIDFSWLKRNLLVRGIIVPLRYKNSAKTYRKIWDKERGSPLMYHTEDLKQKVQNNLGDAFMVEMAMRYQNPSIESVLEKFKSNYVKEIIVLPLFPQYSSACNGSVIQKVQKITNNWLSIPTLKYINHFYNHNLFIEAFVENIKQFDLQKYDHVLFSYHGLPARHLKNADESKKHCLQKTDCCSSINNINYNCYKAQCYATTKLIVEKLSWDSSFYSTSFQSRLGKEIWLEPYTVDVLPKLAKSGKKNILVLSPAFVADCLETLYEITEEYQELFEKNGGTKLQLVPSLNSNETWVNAVCDIIQNA